MKVRDLLKKATKLKKENKVEEAIKVLDEAYKNGIYEPPSYEMEEDEEYTDFDKLITLQDLVRKAKYLQEIGMENIWNHEIELGQYAVEQISSLGSFKVLGNKSKELRGGVVSFIHDTIHPHDIGSLLDGYGIAIRTGHHCAMPLVRSYDVVAASRASFYLYNKKDEIDKLIDGLKKVEEYFK